MTARLNDTDLLAGKPDSRQATTSKMSGEKGQRKSGKRPGRKPVKIDQKAKLERSRQSARECRARKKLRYQYIEELVTNREKAVFALREELQTYKEWCEQVDSGIIAEELKKIILEETDKELENQQVYPPYVNTGGASCVSTVGQSYSGFHPVVTTSAVQPLYSSQEAFQPQIPTPQVATFQGASNYAASTTQQGSYMPNHQGTSQLSKEQQIHNLYLFLKYDEERFSREGTASGSSGTPQSLDTGVASTSTSGVPSVVTDYLELSDSSDSCYS